MKIHITLALGLALALVWGCKPQQVVASPEEPGKQVETPVDKAEKNEFGMPKLLDYQPTFIDLGEVKRGDKRKLEFVYENISDEVVEIEVVTACSCTETDFTEASLNPGEKGKILLTFDSSSKEKSETIDVDIILRNTDPETDYPIVDRVQFKYDLLQ